MAFQFHLRRCRGCGIHQRWFDTRFDLELNLLKTVEKKTVEARTKRYGFCRSNGAPGYRPIAMRAPR